MTTQVITVNLKYRLHGLIGIRRFTLTATDGQWNDLLSGTGTLGLGDTLAGAQILACWGVYAAGVAIASIRDSKNTEIDGTHVPLSLVKSEDPRSAEGWFKSYGPVRQDDKISAWCDVAAGS